MSGNSSSAQVHHDPMCLTSFGDDFIQPPARPCCKDDALVDKGAAAPKLCLSSVETCTLIAAGGLLPAGTVSTAVKTIFPRPLFSWSLGEETKISNSPTNNQLAFSRWRRVIQTKSRQALVFDPGGSTSRLRSCLFLGGWRAFLCREVFV